PTRRSSARRRAPREAVRESHRVPRSEQGPRARPRLAARGAERQADRRSLDRRGGERRGGQGNFQGRPVLGERHAGARQDQSLAQGVPGPESADLTAGNRSAGAVSQRPPARRNDRKKGLRLTLGGEEYQCVSGGDQSCPSGYRPFFGHLPILYSSAIQPPLLPREQLRAVAAATLVVQPGPSRAGAARRATSAT